MSDHGKSGLLPIAPRCLDLELKRCTGSLEAWEATVDERQWRATFQQVRDDQGRLVALWGSEAGNANGAYCVHAALAASFGLLCLTLPLEGTHYPDVSDIFSSAARMQRATADMFGLIPTGATDRRRWLRHGAWPEDRYPLRRTEDRHAASPASADAYPFVVVSGDGVHEIPVGPVHAGTIESGHFRFSVVGEAVLRLEERLAYKHKGIEKLFETLSIESGARLAGRVSGDSTVAYAWAYAMAVESATHCEPPERALWLRALLLERERIANHLGDLGFLGNDAGFSFGLAQFSRLKEDLLRTNALLFGHRYLMDAIVPGGTAADLDSSGATRIRAELAQLQRSMTTLHAIYDEHPGMQDRFMGAGEVKPDLARRLGLCGLAGRASGIVCDLRADLPARPYDQLSVRVASRLAGDVAARVALRFDEIVESLRLCAAILDRLAPGPCRADVLPGALGARGVGWVEGWRGEVLIALELGEGAGIRRLHPHDPSWQNWPVLEHAVLGNIVPDFPLINKSFNLSYSGHDL